VLNLALNAIDPSNLSIADITVDGAGAIAVTVTDDLTRGLIVMNAGVSAANVTSDHLFIAGSHVLIS
jgi:hypothetical protein